MFYMGGGGGGGGKGFSNQKGNYTAPWIRGVGKEVLEIVGGGRGCHGFNGIHPCPVKKGLKSEGTTDGKTPVFRGGDRGIREHHPRGGMLVKWVGVRKSSAQGGRLLCQLQGQGIVGTRSVVGKNLCLVSFQSNHREDCQPQGLKGAREVMAVGG